jgi:hypothetical protein
MSEPAGDIAFGPKMAALPPKRQAFVLALFDEHCPVRRKAQLIYAAKQAGYGGKNSKNPNENLEFIGRRIETDPRVRDAIEEESRRQHRSIAPCAVTALRKVIADPTHRDHLRAIAMVLDRVDPLQAALNVKVEHAPPSAEATAEVIARIAALASQVGAALPAPTPTIEGEAVEVGDDD